MKKIRLQFTGVVVLFLAIGGLNAADTPDKPLSYQTTGDMYGKIKTVDDKSITITMSVPTRTGGGKTARFVNKNSDYTVNFTPDAHARVKTLPPKLDDNGKKAAYTGDELRKLKGTHTNLPGYQVEMSQLRAGQNVEVHVVHVANKEMEKFARWVLIIDDGQQQQPGNKPKDPPKQ